MEENEQPVIDMQMTSQGLSAEQAVEGLKSIIVALAKNGVAPVGEILDALDNELECQGHYPGPDDTMGETQYCDGTCRF